MSRNEVLTPDDIKAPADSAVLDDLEDYQGTYARTRGLDVDAGASVDPPTFETRQTKDAVLYRVLSCRTGVAFIDSGGLVICRTHLVELKNYRFAGKVLRVVVVGVRERLRSYISPVCGMCQAVVSSGNVCYRDECATPLHPQWPAVYCSNECALEDRR